ncbi:hypothetical protein VTN00DRAFT_8074 [Thermoascus crustaceus]|uniref:uncharacterized protein n=1 Tax=Thermoascus crustaceus TaxID=5088 RepID=UPI0037442B3E
MCDHCQQEESQAAQEARLADHVARQMWEDQEKRKTMVAQRVRWMRSQEAIDVMELERTLEQWHQRCPITYSTSEPPPPLPIPPPGKILGPLSTKQLHFYIKTN